MMANIDLLTGLYKESSTKEATDNIQRRPP